MNAADFLVTLPAMFLVQTVLHAFITAVIVERSIRSWKIRSPRVEQRFRLMVVLLPALAFPLYQLIDRERGSLLFRLGALLDSGRWLNMAAGDTLPLSAAGFLVLLATSIAFVLQELIPVARHTFGSGAPRGRQRSLRHDPRITDALASLGGDTPEVIVVDDDRPMICSTAGRRTQIIMSSSLAGTLTPDQMRAALAHEIAHTERSRSPLLVLAFFMRLLMFFNPVVLIEFRRVVRLEELICDDEASRRSGSPHALAGLLETLYLRREERGPGSGRGLSAAVAALERHGHDLNLEARIARLSGGAPGEEDEPWVFKLTVTALAAAAVNYFVV